MKSEISIVPTTGRYKDGVPSASQPTGRYSSSKTDILDIFYQLLKKWRAETFLISSITDKMNHDAFKKIVALGEDVVPLIIAEIRTQPDLIMAALPILTGENPIKDADRGNWDAMADSWIEWYHNSRQ